MSLLKLISLYLLRPLAGIMPHVVLMKLARLAGHLLMHGTSAGTMRKEVRSMLGPEISDAKIDRIVLEGLQNNQKDLFEIWSFPRMNKHKISRIAPFDARENIDQALSYGNGVLVGVTHFGSWKIIIAALAYAGYDTYQVAVDPKAFIDQGGKAYQNKIMDIERQCEDSLPAHFLYIDGFLRELFRAFKSNALVLNSLDGITRKEPVDFKLLNTIVPIDKSAVRLAHRFNAPIVPIFPIRQDNDKHILIVHEPIVLDKTLEPETAIDTAFGQFTDIFTRHVQDHPSHYVRILYQLAKDGYEPSASA